jgi:nucleotide-binding universal stress UspA family protein
MAADAGVAADVTTGSGRGAVRPVLLATLEAPFDPAAAEVAVDAAVESGRRLIVANVVELPPLPLSVMLGYDQIDSPADAESFRAPAELARAFGVEVERLRVRSPRPLTALLELVAELEPSLLVFGPDPKRISARRYRKAAKAISERVTCLVWLAG